MPEVEIGRVSDFFARTVVAGIEFTETPATSAELRRAEVLASERYQNPAWTERA